MSRIAGPIAIIAGLFMTLPGFFALLHAQATLAPMPGWLIRDLVAAAICGGVLMFWGGSVVRQRELELNDLEQARLWLRVRR